MDEVNRTIVWKSFYQDSVTLMRLARDLQDVNGISSVAAIMATPANLDLLSEAGFRRPAEATNAGDLILAFRGADDQAVDIAIGEAGLFFERRAEAKSGGRRPRTIDAALELDPNANLALISVPGDYAVREARRALNLGLHVFLFSDNVSLGDEVALKAHALDLGLLCLGPDCGTAYLDGVGLGFANVIPRGPVGCVAASGTGLQAIGSYLALRGVGISQGIGVGGRDLSDSVGGLMTIAAVERLGRDRATSVIVLVAKSVSRELALRLDRLIESTKKPVIACFLGAEAPRLTHAAYSTNRLDGAALAAAAESGRDSPLPASAIGFTDSDALPRTSRPRGPGLLALFTGGSLAAESAAILSQQAPSVRLDRILDLGADEFTRGRPHPMIDPSLRVKMIRETGNDQTVGVVLLDVVLGRGSHPDPATPLSEAILSARQSAADDGRDLSFVASIIGTVDDPQDLTRQASILRTAGVALCATSARAADLAGRLALGEG